MNALRNRTNKLLDTEQTRQEKVVDPEEFTYYVHHLDGTVEQVTPATGLRLTRTEVVFLLGRLVVARLLRHEIYRVCRTPDMPAVPC